MRFRLLLDLAGLLAGAFVVASLAGACESYEDPLPPFSPAPWAPDAARCQLTVCLTGALDQETDGNDGLEALCMDPAMPGLLPDCHADRCFASFENVLASVADHVLPRVIEALDTSGDGVVDETDDECELSVVGFSWGGVNAVELARLLADDERVASARRHVDRMVLIEPFTPWAGPELTVPDDVRALRTFRRSVIPGDDCTYDLPGGPYLSTVPVCPAGADCELRDFSQAQATWFPGESDDGGWMGLDVTHCLVPWVAYQPALAFLRDEPYDGPLPPRVP